MRGPSSVFDSALDLVGLVSPKGPRVENRRNPQAQPSLLVSRNLYGLNPVQLKQRYPALTTESEWDNTDAASRARLALLGGES